MVSAGGGSLVPRFARTVMMSWSASWNTSTIWLFVSRQTYQCYQHRSMHGVRVGLQFYPYRGATRRAITWLLDAFDLFRWQNSSHCREVETNKMTEWTHPSIWWMDTNFCGSMSSIIKQHVATSLCRLLLGCFENASHSCALPHTQFPRLQQDVCNWCVHDHLPALLGIHLSTVVSQTLFQVFSWEPYH